jgi:hypothetical protein
MNEDFKVFLESSKKSPVYLDDKVIKYIHNELNPNYLKVLLKLIMIQAFIGTITMIFCPQFSYSLTNNYDIFHYFHMNFGAQVCMLLCGCIFVGSGALFASTILTKAEIKKIKKHKYLYYTCLSIIFLSLFILIGAKVYLNLVVYWILGATFGGSCSFELGRQLIQRLSLSLK